MISSNAAYAGHHGTKNSREMVNLGMKRRIIDLSVPLENGLPADPPGYELQIDYIGHRDTLPTLLSRYEGLRESDLPSREAFALEKIHLSTHNGTHVDAPWHYGSKMEDGDRTWTIDEIPLDWFFGPGVKLDFRSFADGYVVQPADVEAELKRIGYKLTPGDIVVINTAAGAVFGQPGYHKRGCGMGRAATLYLTERGIRVAGIDTWSWDASFEHMAKAYAERKDPAVIWEGHRAGLKMPYCQIEKLHNLEVLPPYGFVIACFPVKITGASAGWTRAVAIMDE